MQLLSAPSYSAHSAAVNAVVQKPPYEQQLEPLLRAGSALQSPNEPRPAKQPCPPSHSEHPPVGDMQQIPAPHALQSVRQSLLGQLVQTPLSH